jgi:hypothetical protein
MNADAGNASRCHDRPGTYEAFLANVVVDGAIALITYWLYSGPHGVGGPALSQQVERT